MSTFSSGALVIHTPSIPGKIENVAKRIAIIHAELLLIHPFRDGNGRLARWLADLMALQAGYPAPAYRFEGKKNAAIRRIYLNAVLKGYVEDYEPLTSFFAEAITARVAE